MPKYKTTVDRWLSHECRLVRAGDEFVTEFPQVKGKNGKLTPMDLGDNLVEVKGGKQPAKSDDNGDAGKSSEGGKGNDDLT